MFRQLVFPLILLDIRHLHPLDGLIELFPCQQSFLAGEITVLNEGETRFAELLLERTLGLARCRKRTGSSEHKDL